MYLRNLPTEFVKGEKSRLAYYSVEARDLKALGWKEKIKEQKQAKSVQQAPVEPIAPAPAPAVAPAPEPVVSAPAAPEPTPEVPAIQEPAPTAEVVADGEPDFNAWTRPELFKYALERGLDLPNNALKAELVEACNSLK